MISGAVAGLGTITPASGFVLPWHGIVIGIVAGAICYWACTKLKTKLGYDDSLDVFGVHGIGGADRHDPGRRVRGRGLVGRPPVGPDRRQRADLLLSQLYGVGVTLVWSGHRHLRAAEGRSASSCRCGCATRTSGWVSTCRCTERRFNRHDFWPLNRRSVTASTFSLHRF